MSLLSVVFVLLVAIVDVPLTTGQSTCQATKSDQSGENFYLPGAPMGQVPFMVCNNTPTDDRLFINGTVVSTLCTGIKDVQLEIWQACSNGSYSQGNDWSCRTTIQTDENGAFNFSTVMPGREVDSLGNYRPANIHFRVNAPTGYNELITELYFRGDLYLAPNDSCMTCSSNDPSLVIPLIPFNGDIKTWTGMWQIVLETKSSSSNILNGLINNLQPIVGQIEQEASQALEPIVGQIQQEGSALKPMLGQIQQEASQALEPIVGQIQQEGSALKPMVGQIQQEASQALKPIVGQIQQEASNALAPIVVQAQQEASGQLKPVGAQAGSILHGILKGFGR